MNEWKAKKLHCSFDAWACSLTNSCNNTKIILIIVCKRKQQTYAEELAWQIRLMAYFSLRPFLFSLSSFLPFLPFSSPYLSAAVGFGKHYWFWWHFITWLAQAGDRLRLHQLFLFCALKCHSDSAWVTQPTTHDYKITSMECHKLIRQSKIQQYTHPASIKLFSEHELRP